MKKIIFILICFLFSACATQSNLENTNINLAFALLEQHAYPQAKTILYQAIISEPHSAITNMAFAIYWQAVDDTTQANFYFSRALKFSPNNPEVLNNFGSFLCATGNYQQGLEKILLAASEPGYGNSDLAYKNASECEKRLGNLWQANLDLQKAKELSGK